MALAQEIRRYAEGPAGRIPEDWPVLAGLPREPTELIDADVSTITGAADKVLRVQGKHPFILHVELQSARDASLPRRIHVYNAILEHRHGLPVHSMVLLVSSQANHPNLTGSYEQGLRGERSYLTFRYQVIRVWQEPPERFLYAGRGLLPLATISAVTPSELPDIIRRMAERLEGGRPHAGELWTAANLLMGLRYEAAFIQRMLEGVVGMEESVTYQAIKREGERKGKREGAITEARRLLLALGRKRFGSEDTATAESIQSINSIHRLEELLLSADCVDTWEELLASQPSRPKPRRGRTKPNGKPKSP